VTIRYKTPGGLASRTFTVYRTHHGPITRTEGDRWVAAALMNTPIPALEQSFLRTKQRDYASFMKIAGLKANSSNNTLFADSKGHIAYLHPQFIPRRDDRFDYTKPVDGSNPATDWKGLHELDEAPRAVDPPNGWVFNVNDSPYSAAGPYSPKKADFPRYMDTAGETPRTKHANLVLAGKSGFTLDSLLQAAYDPYLPAFGDLIPALAAAWDSTPGSDPLKARTRDQVAALRAWDKRWGVASTETSLAVFWGENLYRASIEDARARGIDIYAYMASQTSPAQKLQALAEASDRLQADFGSWRTPWGEINRFQRLTNDIVATFHDDQPSIPTPFTSAQWGSLASFGAKRQPQTKRYYGTLGNSFVAVVEFGNRVRARAVTAGGESGDPASPHFNDQAARYVAGNLRDVYFYPDQLKEHVERTYHPGS
jgi:acyl-homoserine-lactone acylase